MKNLYIIGAGGVGKEIVWIVEQINKKHPTWTIAGFIDDNKEIHGLTMNGIPIVGGIDFLLNKEWDEDIFVVCAIANYRVKKSIVERLSDKVSFANIIHPDVYISSTNKIGLGVIIYPGAIITTNVTIGNHVIISPKCGVGHETIINDYCSLLWNVNVSGNDVLEEGCLIGSGATIIQNKKIGCGSIVGAGAVVISDINNNVVVVGCPAIVKKHLSK